MKVHAFLSLLLYLPFPLPGHFHLRGNLNSHRALNEFAPGLFK